MTFEETITNAIKQGIKEAFQELQPMQQDDTPKVMNTKQAGERAGVSTATIINWTHRADCDFAVRVGRTVRILTHKFDAWMERTAKGEILAD